MAQHDKLLLQCRPLTTTSTTSPVLLLREAQRHSQVAKEKSLSDCVLAHGLKPDLSYSSPTLKVAKPREEPTFFAPGRHHNFDQAVVLLPSMTRTQSKLCPVVTSFWHLVEAIRTAFPALRACGQIQLLSCRNDYCSGGRIVNNADASFASLVHHVR